MTKREQQIELVRKFISQYWALERRNCSMVEWVMLKLSCSRTKAQRLITETTEDRE